ncbi:hypothetical protein MOF23_22300 [Bacillus inaquosorum]|uniref:hypothetical protein n=1 Tax=Bacillus inaquosorum TaxID=483913 RepID=UPI002281F680|nr:hypothetical protein [Bacillus inaquosorum]MCY9311666.1 hypothetical protein [Bacillus inaquosorum]MCY9367526.1 hypothetical protein [Bacillus spizizenii]
MEVIKSLLFILNGVLLHMYSKGTASKLQQHVTNLFILSSIVWLISFWFFPFWKLIVLMGYLLVIMFGLKTVLLKLGNGTFVFPPKWLIWFSVCSVIIGSLVHLSNEFILVLGTVWWTILVYTEYKQKNKDRRLKTYSYNHKNNPSHQFLNDREKIIKRIKTENIILEQSFLHSPALYRYTTETNIADNTVLRRYIIEPLFPEISVNRQAHYLAHELGHHIDSIQRKSNFHQFITRCRDAKRFKPICGLFVLYDEWSAWNHAEGICIEEGVDINFFHHTRKVAYSSYVRKYWENVFKPLKTLIASYLFSVAVVLISVLLNDTGIHLPFSLDNITRFIADSPNRTNVVNVVFYNCMFLQFFKWIVGGWFFKQTETDHQLVQ